MEFLIEAAGLAKNYPGRAQPAVADLNLRVAAGEIFGFLGPNGAGKTTTIRMLAGILRPDGGRVRVAGVDLSRDPVAAKARLGYVPDEPALYERLTGAEHLNFLGDVYGVDRATRARRGGELARRLELADSLGMAIGGYSRGMRQKLAIIGALLHDPAVLFLDEPLVGLDPKAARHLKDLLRELTAAGRAVFFSTHGLEVAQGLCDRVAIIDAGRLIAEGTPEELGATPERAGSLEELFLRLTGGQDR
ncbi:MAG: ABC transporter ATP-binding protein [Thermaerobacter sp.]|jgi:ABC-2 type transport system ATP-binding protein|nr:ABC transporter ATP-binding protein [Thermaerobacter sp.]